MTNYLVLDLEVNTLQMHGRIANPWFNDIVAIGLKTKEELCSKYIYPDKLSKLDLEGIDVIVGHNIKFDLLYLWKEEWLQEYFKRGGKIFDTQYAEYTLSGQVSKYPALREISIKYGCPEREKFMEEYWDKKVNTCDIPKELVLKDVENDVLDTEQIYLKQVEKAKKLGMTNLLELEMDAILATTEMEFNGMYIDKAVLLEEKAKLEEELRQQYNRLSIITNRYWG